MKAKDIFYGIIIAVLLLLLLQEKACNKQPLQSKIVYSSDTVYVKVHDTTEAYRPAVTEFIPLYIPVTDKNPVDSQAIIDEWQARNFYYNQPVDTMAILQRYFSASIYRDTQKITYGQAIITDTISQNRIQGRKLSFEQSIPVVTRTVAIPVRNQVYFSLMAAAGKNTPVDIGAGILFMHKRGMGVEAGTYRNSANGQHYFLSYKHKLSIKK